APSPKYDRLASASTAMPNWSASMTINVGAMFGSRWRRMMPRVLVPLVRAAVTNWAEATLFARMREMRATTADMASPIATIADHSDGGCRATMSIAVR